MREVLEQVANDLRHICFSLPDCEEKTKLIRLRSYVENRLAPRAEEHISNRDVYEDLARMDRIQLNNFRRRLRDTLQKGKAHYRGEPVSDLYHRAVQRSEQLAAGYAKAGRPVTPL